MTHLLLVSPREGTDVACAEYGDFVATIDGPVTLDQRLLREQTPDIGPIDSYDGVIVGGSPFNVSTTNKTPLNTHIEDELASLIDGPVPVLFVCYGTGLVASRMGGSVGRTHPEEAGKTVVTLNDAAATDPLCDNLAPSFTALAGHKENVVDPGRCVVLAGGGCPVQILRYGDHTWACQFHPEMDGNAMHTRMDFYRDYGYFDNDAYNAIVALLPSIDTTQSAKFLNNFVRLCRNWRAGHAG